MATTLGRTGTWHWYLLNENDQRTRKLDNVKDGATLEFNQNATIRGGGTLTLTTNTPTTVDWMTARLQPVYVDEETGMETPFGVFVPNVPETAYTPAAQSLTVKLLDKTSVLNQWATRSTYAVDQGVNIVQAVQDVLAMAGQTRVAVTPSDKMTGGAIVWEPGTTLLRIANDLLDAANYRALYVDRAGVFHVDPYQPPAVRPVAFTFVEGEDSVHQGEWVLASDEASTPNHVVCVGQAVGDAPPLVGEATNTDPASPYSTVRRGRVISRVYENVEAADQEVIDALAARRLLELTTPAVTLKSVKHALVDVNVSDVVRFTSQGVDVLATVERMTVTTTPGALMRSDFRAVKV